MDPKLYKAAKEGDVSSLSEVDGRNRTEEEAMNNRYGNFLNRTQYGDNNILHIAARAGHAIFVSEVLGHFPFLSDQVNTQGDNPLFVAARFGHLKVVEILAKPATAGENGTNLSSSRRRQRDLEEGLVDHQLDVQIPHPWLVKNSKQYTTALHEALRNGHEPVARYLLKLDPEMANLVNGAGESPLFLAARTRCELFMLDILLSGQPYSTEGPHGLTALHAARDCYDRIISELIKQKPDLLRQFDNRGKAAIHYAVEADYFVLLHQMLKADASIALLPDAEGYTPLLRASSKGSLKSCQVILKMCPESVEARNRQGQNALHLFKLNKFGDGIKFLSIPEICELRNVGDDEGNTPLHLAVKENEYVMTMQLASLRNIDLGAVNKDGLTALDLCESELNVFTRQKMLRFRLWLCGAPRGQCGVIEQNVPSRGSSLIHRNVDLKGFINTVALVASLIATLTFAALFAMPGGYGTSPDDLGVANLVKKAALKVFLLSDTMAMICSVCVVFLLSKAMITEHEDAMLSLANTSWLLLNLSLPATLVAFMSGVFAVVARKALWLAILVCIACSTAPLLIRPGRVLRSMLEICFPPTLLTREFQRQAQRLCRMVKRRWEQRYIQSQIQKHVIV